MLKILILAKQKTKQNLRWKTTMEDLKISNVEYLSNHLLDHTQILNLSIDDQTMFSNSSNDELQWEMTPKYKSGISRHLLSFLNLSFKWRGPKNIKNEISQQPLIGYYSNFNLRLEDQIIVYKYFKWRRPSMEGTS